VTQPNAAFLTHRRKSGLFQHTNMFGDSREGHVEVAREVADRPVTAGELSENGASGGVGECAEGSVELIL
jgi:hypothetical protein